MDSILITDPRRKIHQDLIYADQRQVEKTGYSPRWKITPGTDALEYTLNIFLERAVPYSNFRSPMTKVLEILTS